MKSIKKALIDLVASIPISLMIAVLLLMIAIAVIYGLTRILS
ncbi:MAG: hypothetical protein R3242_01890 [Akkermansiaceae bacterium]|nr:hypothetical protein [Akkermansiaceae bacterium]